MEIVNIDWKEVPGGIIPQDISDFYRKIIEKMSDERFSRRFIESEISGANKAALCILDRLNFISTAIAATQYCEYNFAHNLRNDLQAKTEGLRTFYNDFVKFQQNLAYYLDGKWENHFKTQEATITEVRKNSDKVERQLKEIMNGIQAIYEKPSQTRQADLDTPHILMYVDKLERSFKALDTRLTEEIASRQTSESMSVHELKKYIATAHSFLKENTKTINEELYIKLYKDQLALKETLISQIKRQNDYSESLDRIEKKIEQKQEITCKFKETPSVIIKEESSTGRIRNDGLDKTKKVASLTPSIGHQNLMIQRVRDSSSNIRTWWRERNISHPLQWKE
ncbi:hypothetical protein LguiB_016364 [Lonicera macranthoides]